jgi:hypothetical protein
LKNTTIAKILIFLGFFLGIIIDNINASEQYPDILVYNGIEYEIGSYPMETYFEIYPNRRPGSIGTNSALSRGYRARYEIINSELILMGIETMRLNGNWRKVSNNYFNNKMKVSTFTGKLNLFNGEITGVYMAFTPIYENYIILEINKGNFVNVYNINCYEYLESIIQLYSDESYEYGYFTGLLSKLYEIER